MHNQTKNLFLFLILVLGSLSLSAQRESRKLSPEILFKDRYLASKGVYGILPLKDGEHYTRLQNDTLFIYSYKTGQKNGYLVTGSNIITEKGDTLELSDFSFSDDQKKMLIAVNSEAIYRHSSISDYYVYDLDSKKVTAVSDAGKQRLVSFSPDGSKVAFVRNNNLFIKDLISLTETPVTTDGLNNSIIYGTTDWVYEEEFAITQGFWWSKDGSKLAYYRFDESKVKEFSFPEYGSLYPSNYTYKYPKAGEDNSIVSVHIYNLNDKKSIAVDLGSETDQYIPRVQWSNIPNQLSVFRMNRLQNKLEILLADANTGASKVVFTETNPCYIEITDDMTWLPQPGEFLITSERDGYNHIYLCNINGTVKQLTTGKWDVESISGFDLNRNLIWFSAANHGPYNRDICTVDLKGKMKTVTENEGWNKAEFSTGFNYFIHTWSDMNNPPVITIRNDKGKGLRIIEDNARLRERLKEFNLRKRELFSFKTEEGVELNGWMIKPDNFDKNKRYPVLVYLYGGPGSQTVRNNWEGGQLWYQYMAQEGILVVSVDNRGTGFRGEEFKKITYKQLGKYETEDQIATAKWLIKEGYADPAKIGIFGWSYGGYMSTLCMTKGADYFSTGIAVAPVTNWRYYDNIYTERFMQKPQDNPAGYDDNSPISHVSKLKGNYLLIHGSSDDNVHFQNTMDLTTALVAANKQF
nr:S9 family peptidase [Bacteroidales bacterium]